MSTPVDITALNIDEIMLNRLSVGDVLFQMIRQADCDIEGGDRLVS